MSDLSRLRRLATFCLLAATAGLAVLGARGFQQKLESFQPLGFTAISAGDHWEVRTVDPMFESALVPGDRIVLVDGSEARQGTRLASALRDAPTAQLVVLRQERLETVEYRRPPLDIDAPYLILALIGCAYAAVGLFVIWRSSATAGGPLFFLWCLVSAVLYVFSPVFPPDAPGALDLLLRRGGAAAAAAADAAPLPLDSPPRPAAKRLLWLPFLYLPAAVLTLFQADLAWANGTWLVGAPSVRLLAMLDRIELAHLLSFAALSVVVLARRLSALHDWEQQRQLLWLLVGMAAGYLPFFLFHGLPAILGLELPESLSALAVLPLACVPFAFAWAVLRYRLWDLGVMVRNGLSYTLTLIFGLTTFSLIDLAVRRSMPADLGFTRDLLTFIGGILAVGLVVPTHRGIHGALERLQYGRAFGHRRGLQRVAQDLLQERDLDRLCQALLSEVEQALDLERANLVLLQGPALVPVRPHPGFPRALALATLRDGLWEGEFDTLSPIGLARRVGDDRAAALCRRLSLCVPASGPRPEDRPGARLAAPRSAAAVDRRRRDRPGAARPGGARHRERPTPRSGPPAARAGDLAAAPQRGDSRVLAGRHRGARFRRAWSRAPTSPSPPSPAAPAASSSAAGSSTSSRSRRCPSPARACASSRTRTPAAPHATCS